MTFRKNIYLKIKSKMSIKSLSQILPKIIAMCNLELIIDLFNQIISNIMSSPKINQSTKNFKISIEMIMKYLNKMIIQQQTIKITKRW